METYGIASDVQLFIMHKCESFYLTQPEFGELFQMFPSLSRTLGASSVRGWEFMRRSVVTMFVCPMQGNVDELVMLFELATLRLFAYFNNYLHAPSDCFNICFYFIN